MCLTMIDPAASWFEIIKLPVITEAIIPLDKKGCKGKMTLKQPKLSFVDKSSAMISNLVNKTWFIHYPHCRQIIYDDGNEFILQVKVVCESFIWESES